MEENATSSKLPLEKVHAFLLPFLLPVSYSMNGKLSTKQRSHVTQQKSQDENSETVGLRPTVSQLPRLLKTFNTNYWIYLRNYRLGA